MSHQTKMNQNCRYFSPQTLIVTFPFVTLRMLNPTVGIMSSLKLPLCKNIRKKYYNPKNASRDKKSIIESCRGPTKKFHEIRTTIVVVYK